MYRIKWFHTDCYSHDTTRFVSNIQKLEALLEKLLELPNIRIMIWARQLGKWKKIYNDYREALIAKGLYNESRSVSSIRPA